MAWYADVLIAPSGGDYTALNTFEAAYDGLDMSGTDGVRARLQGTDGTSSNFIYWGDWVTPLSETCKVVVQADDGYETDGFDGDGTTNARNAKTWSVYGTVSEPNYFDIKNIEFYNSSVSGVTSPGMCGVVRISKCVFRDSAIALGSVILQGVYSGGTATMYVGGCLIKDQTGTYGMGIRIAADNVNATIVAINNTVYECHYYGIVTTYSNPTLNAINNAVYSSTHTDVAGLDVDTTNLTGDDADIVNTDGVDWTEPSTDDFTIPDTDSALYEAGTTVVDSWFTELCPTDFAGTTWRTPPSVGCFEYVSGVFEILSTETVAVADSLTKIFMLGSVCWGNTDEGNEDMYKTFTTYWTGTGSVSGSGDSEKISLDAGEYMESETWNTGAVDVELTLNKYETGLGSCVVKYKTGTTQADCEGQAWATYSSPFTSGGWVKVRIEN